jgi:hypothetical protein
VMRKLSFVRRMVTTRWIRIGAKDDAMESDTVVVVDGEEEEEEEDDIDIVLQNALTLYHVRLNDLSALHGSRHFIFIWRLNT